MTSPQVHPDWFDAAMPSRERCVLGEILDAGAARHPDRVFARFENGEKWSWAETRSRVRRLAASLQRLGVRKGESVLAWLPNGPDIILAWFAANYLGAVYAPINTAYRGELLGHVIANSGARILFAHPLLCDRLHDCATTGLETVVVCGDQDVSLPAGIEAHRFAAVLAAGEGTDPLPEEPVMPWDTLAIIYTSGTTGPSKGILCSHLHFWTIGTLAVGYMQEHERCMVNLPLFHIGAAGGVYGALACHAGIAVVEGFSTERFWQQIREMDCAAACGLVGSMVAFLAKRPRADDDRDNPLRRVLAAPVNEVLIELAQRHGFEYFTGFGMGEAPIPLISAIDPGTQGAGYCGSPRAGIECRIVDEHDQAVADGTVGELIVRADLPWSLNHGYAGMPEATLNAWRNGWFHTGDGFVRDAAGRYFFVDRIKDSIRRRGENISSLEVEAAVLAHPAVQDAAAIPVPSEFGEDEVMVVVEALPGERPDAAELTEFLIPRLAYFMVPRFIRFVDSLPKTPTNKVRKFLLRELGVTTDTWDREAAGIVLKRDRLA